MKGTPEEAVNSEDVKTKSLSSVDDKELKDDEVLRKNIRRNTTNR